MSHRCEEMLHVELAGQTALAWCKSDATHVVDTGAEHPLRLCEAHAERRVAVEHGIALFPVPAGQACLRCWHPATFGSNYCQPHRDSLTKKIREAALKA